MSIPPVRMGQKDPTVLFTVWQPFGAKRPQSVTYVPLSVLYYLRGLTEAEWQEVLEGRHPEIRLGQV